MHLTELFPGLKYIVIIACTIILLYCSHLLISFQTDDYCQDYIAANRFLAGQTIYAPVNCWIGLSTFAPVHYPAHPPFSLFLFLPLALFSYQNSLFIWWFISVISYFVSGLILLKFLNHFTLISIIIFTIFSVFWQGFYKSYTLHNMTPLLFLLLVSSLAFLHRGKSSSAGLLLGLAALIKVWPIVLVVMALAVRELRLFKSAVLTIITGGFLAFLIFGWTEHLRYLKFILPNEKFYYPDPSNLSLPGLITRFSSGFPFLKLAPVISGVTLENGAMIGNIAGISILILIITVSRLVLLRYKAYHLHLHFIYGLAVLLAFLVFPISWNHGILLLVLPIIMLIFKLGHPVNTKLARAILLIMIPVMVIFPGWGLPFEIFRISSNNLVSNTIISGWPTAWLTLSLSTYLFFLISSAKFPLRHSDKRS